MIPHLPALCVCVCVCACGCIGFVFAHKFDINFALLFKWLCMGVGWASGSVVVDSCRCSSSSCPSRRRLCFVVSSVLLFGFWNNADLKNVSLFLRPVVTVTMLFVGTSFIVPWYHITAGSGKPGLDILLVKAKYESIFECYGNDDKGEGQVWH